MTHPAYDHLLLARVIPENELNFFAIEYELERPLLLVALASTAIALWFGLRPRDLRCFVVKPALCAGCAAAIAFALSDLLPSDRYMARAPIAWLLPAVGLVALLAREPPRAFGLVVVAALTAQLAITGYAIHGWVRYKRLLVHELAESRGVVMGSEWERKARAALPPSGQGYYWSWAAPYASIMTTFGQHRAAVIVDNQGWYAPMTCADARGILPTVRWHRARDAEAIINDVCAKSPR
jgi:hypothetical protein